jgi:hypothetical protein
MRAGKLEKKERSNFQRHNKESKRENTKEETLNSRI